MVSNRPRGALIHHTNPLLLTHLFFLSLSVCLCVQVTLGEIMSVFGLCTMLSEGLLVRISVPYFGEKASMQIGA